MKNEKDKEIPQNSQGSSSSVIKLLYFSSFLTGSIGTAFFLKNEAQQENNISEYALYTFALCLAGIFFTTAKTLSAIKKSKSNSKGQVLLAESSFYCKRREKESCSLSMSLVAPVTIRHPLLSDISSLGGIYKMIQNKPLR